LCCGCFYTQAKRGKMNGLIYSINVLLIGIFSFYVWRKSDINLRKFFWPALLFKLAAGISLGLIYTYYYNVSDTFTFFKDAKTLAAFARENFYQYVSFLWNGDESFYVWSQLFYVESRTLFFVKGLSVVSLITNDSYWISSLWFSFVSFLGCWFLFDKLVNQFRDAEWPAALSFLFFPSFVFWGSGIIKESIAAGALCFIIGVFILIANKIKLVWWNWMIIIFSLYILWNLKYYWAAVLIPTIVTTIIMTYGVERWIEFKSKVAQAGLWLIIFITLCVGVSFVHPNFYLEQLLFVIVENHDLLSRISSSQGIIHFYHLQPDWLSVLINSPWALFSGIFRPFVFESHNVFHIMAGVENLVLLIFFIFSVSRFKLIIHSSAHLMIYSAIVYVTLLCIFLSLSTPNFGTLSRYRIGFLPVFCFLIFYNNPLWDKLKSFRK
jgi:hypothetical protein